MRVRLTFEEPFPPYKCWYEVPETCQTIRDLQRAIRKGFKLNSVCKTTRLDLDGFYLLPGSTIAGSIKDSDLLQVMIRRKNDALPHSSLPVAGGRRKRSRDDAGLAPEERKSSSKKKRIEPTQSQKPASAKNTQKEVSQATKQQHQQQPKRLLADGTGSRKRNRNRGKVAKAKQNPPNAAAKTLQQTTKKKTGATPPAKSGAKQKTPQNTATAKKQPTKGAAKSQQPGKLGTKPKQPAITATTKKQAGLTKKGKGRRQQQVVAKEAEESSSSPSSSSDSSSDSDASDSDSDDSDSDSGSSSSSSDSSDSGDDSEAEPESATPLRSPPFQGSISTKTRNGRRKIGEQRKQEAANTTTPFEAQREASGAKNLKAAPRVKMTTVELVDIGAGARKKAAPMRNAPPKHAQEPSLVVTRASAAASAKLATTAASAPKESGDRKEPVSPSWSNVVEAERESDNEPRDYDLLPKLEGDPKVGDVIAYKTLEMSPQYMPIVSEFREATVLKFSEADMEAEVQLARRFRTPVELDDEGNPILGKFDVYNADKIELARRGIVVLDMMSLYDCRKVV